jgi:carbamoyl-phosphate synthase large subunit
MRSTGEVMGIDADFPSAFAKACFAVNDHLPLQGTVFASVMDVDKEAIVEPIRRLRRLGYQVLATRGTAEFLVAQGVPAERVYKVQEERRPHIVDRMLNGDVHLVVNTTVDKKSVQDSFSIRETALKSGIPYATTIPAFKAAVASIELLRTRALDVRSLQEYYQGD